MTRTKVLNGKRVELTPEENAARDAAEAYENSPERVQEANREIADAAVQRLEVSGIDKAQFEAILDHENRIRALEGRPAVNRQQLINWVKDRVI